MYWIENDKDGLTLEAEVNGEGPGEAYFIKCDVTKEEDIKVCINSMFYFSLYPLFVSVCFV